MNLENLIQITEKLTPVETEVGYFILKNKKEVIQMSVNELVSQSHISKSVIHRFCKKIGLTGFNELKVLIAKEVSEAGHDMEWIDVNYPFQKKDGPQLIAKKLAKLYETAIYDTYHYIDFMQIHQVAKLLNRAQVVDVYTHAHNMNIAENFQDKMLTIGKMVNCPKGFYHQRLTVLASSNDRVALILSYSGRASFIKPILQALYQKKIPVILIGKAGSNLYPQYVKYALNISGQENLRDRLSQFSSHIAMQYMLDMLFACLYNIDREKNINYLKTSIDFMDDREFEE